jgi:hypothetical protein
MQSLVAAFMRYAGRPVAMLGAMIRAMIAMMAITTINSVSENPCEFLIIHDPPIIIISAGSMPQGFFILSF